MSVYREIAKLINISKHKEMFDNKIQNPLCDDYLSKSHLLVNIKRSIYDSNLKDRCFKIEGNLLRLYINNVLSVETCFDINKPDKFFGKIYVSIHDLKSYVEHKSLARNFLSELFKYIKIELGYNIITLIVYKDNINALNLYFDTGFEIFMDYDNSYCLVKYL